MKRLLALLVAAVMITGAFWVRDRIDGSSSSGGDGGDTTAAATLVCATELAAACQTIHDAHPEVTVRVEDAQTTLDRLSAADFDATSAARDPATAIDGWLVPQPWPQMVAEQRQRAGSGSSPSGTSRPRWPARLW